MYQKIFFLIAISFVTTAAQAQDVHEFSGPGCTSHGDWTRAAVDETQNIAQILTGLLNNPDCKGLSNAVGDLRVAARQMREAQPDSGNPSSIKNERSVDELKTIGEAIISPSGRPNATAASTFFTHLLGAAQNSSLLSPGFTGSLFSSPGSTVNTFATMFDNSAHVAEQGMNAVSAIMKVLPQNDRCLIGHPHEGLLLLSSLVRMTSALSTSTSGANSAVSNTLAGLATMMRDRQFTTALRGTDRATFSNSVSCLIETVSQHWCEIDNAQRVMQFFQQQRESELAQNKWNDASSNSFQQGKSFMGKTDENQLPLVSGNPLNGYYLLTRELPIIADWLQKVQIGAEPRLHTSGTFQTEVIQKQADQMKLAKTVMAQFNEDIKVLKTYEPGVKQQNQIFVTLSNLTNNLSSTGVAGDAGFISNSYNSLKLPFFLIGQDVPREVTGAAATAMSWQSYMQQNPMYGPGYIPAFRDPVALSKTMEIQLKEVLKQGGRNASAYYRNFMIADRVNLVNETASGPLLSVKGAFQNVYIYLTSLQNELRKASGDPAIISSMGELKVRIRRFMQTNQDYEALSADLDKQALAIAKMTAKTADDKSARTDAYKNFKISEQTLAAADKVIDSAYDEFNISLSNDGFVTTKMRNFIQMDLKNRLDAMRVSTNARGSTQSVLTSKADLLNYALKVLTEDPTLAQLDLAQAKAVVNGNLHTLASTFKDTLYYMILEKKSYVQGWNGEQFGNHLKAKMGEHTTGIFTTLVPWMAWVDGESKHPDLAAEINYLYRGVHIDDQYHSQQKVMALYCALSLSLYNRSYFMDICKGSVLPTFYREKKISLDLTYDRFMPDLESAKRIAKNPALNARTTCSFNRYLLNNKIAYIIDQDQRQFNKTNENTSNPIDLFDRVDQRQGN